VQNWNLFSERIVHFTDAKQLAALTNTC